MTKTDGTTKLKNWLSMLGYLKQAIAKGHRRYLVASIAVHVVVVILMTWSWSSTEAVKTYVIPQSLEARVLASEEVDRLPYKQKQRQDAEAAKKKQADELKRKNEAKRQRELAKKKAAEERKRKQALAKQKAKEKEAQKQKVLAAKKKAEDAKKKQEQEKLERQRIEQQKKLAQEKKQAELDESERLDKLVKEREERLREQRLAERLKGIQDLSTPVSSDDEPQLDADEKTRYTSIMRSRIESRWLKPPGATTGDYYVVLRIELFPSGELSSVRVIESSGSSALDQSALAAVRAVNKFEVPTEAAFFDKYFRSFQMSFRPAD